ncbi:MAG: hypothetical protein ACOZDY_10630 [Pseudomonadota bacterium]
MSKLPATPPPPKARRRRKAKAAEQNPQANLQTRRVLSQHYRAKYGVK